MRKFSDAQLAALGMARLLVQFWNELDATLLQQTIAEAVHEGHPELEEWKRLRNAVNEATVGYTATTLDLQQRASDQLRTQSGLIRASKRGDEMTNKKTPFGYKIVPFAGLVYPSLDPKQKRSEPVEVADLCSSNECVFKATLHTHRGDRPWNLKN